MAPPHDKKVKPRSFRENVLVFKKIMPFKEDLRGKFKPKFEGPHVATKDLSRRALYLSGIDEIHPLSL